MSDADLETAVSDNDGVVFEEEDSYYADVMLGDVNGSLTLADDQLMFSPMVGCKQSWKMSSLEGKEVDTDDNVLTLRFQNEAKAVEIKLSFRSDLERLYEDLDSRKMRSELRNLEDACESALTRLSTVNQEVDGEQVDGEQEAPLVARGRPFTKSTRRSTAMHPVFRKAGSGPVSSLLVRKLSAFQPNEPTEEEMVTALTEDIYSLMFVADTAGPGFWFAIFSFMTQASILILLFLDLVDTSANPPINNDGTTNRLNIPVGVPVTVSLAQFVGMYLSITFFLDQGDLIRGFEHLCNGYDESVRLDAPKATFAKWLLAGCLQSSVGVMMVLNLFVLLMQSSDVLSFCLNFAALHFVQDLDDVAFSVATMGLISKRIQEECLAVCNVMIPENLKERTLWLRKALLFLLTVGLYTGFFMIWTKQASGAWRCSTVYMQFGDAFAPELSYYSGKFYSQSDSLTVGRPSFLHETGELKLEYSSSISAWVVKWAEEGRSSYLVRSSETDTFDVTSVADQGWFAHMQVGDIPMDFLALTCADCSTDTCLSENGRCIENACVCNDGYMGLSCEIQVPECQFYALDYRTSSGLAQRSGGSSFGNGEYTSNVSWVIVNQEMQSIKVFDRMIYYHMYLKSILFFTGRRWIMFGPTEGIDNEIELVQGLEMEENMTSLDAARALQNHTKFNPLYFSSPMDYGTTSNGADFRSLTWFSAIKAKEDHQGEVILGYKSSIFGYVPDVESPITAKFLCSECVEDNDCDNQGICDPSGQCQCQLFYSGFRCEQVNSCHDMGCFNGGTCDYFTGMCKNCLNDGYGNLCQYPAPPLNDPFFCDSRAYFDDWGFRWPFRGYCANGQRCDPVEEKCECEPPYYGDACINSTQASCWPIDIPFSNWTDPCLNGGYCEYTQLSHASCVCPKGFSGDFCEIEDAPSASNETLSLPKTRQYTPRRSRGPKN